MQYMKAAHRGPIYICKNEYTIWIYIIIIILKFLQQMCCGVGWGWNSPSVSLVLVCFFWEWWTKTEPYCLLQPVTKKSYSWMVTANSIQTYVCFDKVHSGHTTEYQCTRVAISLIMELLQGPRARMPWLRFPRMKVFFWGFQKRTCFIFSK